MWQVNKMDLTVLYDFLKSGNVVQCASVEERERLLDMAEASGLTLGFDPRNYHNYDWPYVYYDDEFREVHIRLYKDDSSSLTFSDLLVAMSEQPDIAGAFDAMLHE